MRTPKDFDHDYEKMREESRRFGLLVKWWLWACLFLAMPVLLAVLAAIVGGLWWLFTGKPMFGG